MQEKFTARFFEKIAESGKSHAEIAVLLHINVHDIIRWASGKNRYLPSVEKLLLFANFFGCSVDYLLGLSDDDTADFVMIDEPKIAGRFRKIVYEERGFTFARLSKETGIRNTTLFYMGQRQGKTANRKFGKSGARVGDFRRLFHRQGEIIPLFR